MSGNWVHPIPTGDAFLVDRVLYDIQHDRGEEARFFADPDAYVTAAGLTGAVAQAVVEQDVTALYRLGANPYLLRSYCLQLRMPEGDYLAALRAAAPEVNHG